MSAYDIVCSEAGNARFEFFPVDLRVAVAVVGFSSVQYWVSLLLAGSEF